MKIVFTSELKNSISEMQAALDKRNQIDSAIEKNVADVAASKAAHDLAENALAAAEVALACATTNAEAIANEKIVARARKDADTKCSDYARAQRITGALHASARTADEKIDELKSMLEIERNIFATEIVEQYEQILVESVQPLLRVLALGTVLRGFIPSQNLSDVISNTTVPSALHFGSPIVGNARYTKPDGGVSELASLDHPAAAAITEALNPLKNIQRAVSAHRKFNPSVAAPYVTRGITISHGSPSNKPARIQAEPQRAAEAAREMNVTGGVGGASPAEAEWQQTMGNANR